PTFAKLKADAAKISKHFNDVSLLIFFTPARVSNHTIAQWAGELREAYGYDLVVSPREELITELLMPGNASICQSLLGLPIPVDPPIAARWDRARRACAAETSLWAAHPRLVGKPRIALRAIPVDARGSEASAILELTAIRGLLVHGRRLIL